MTSLTVSDIFIRVQRTFGDEAGVQIAEDDIIRWINDAQQEACNQVLNLLPTVAYLDSVEGQNKYSVPSNLYTLSQVYYQDSSCLSYYSLRYFSLFDFSQHVDGWDGKLYAENIPAMYTKEADQLVIFPQPRESFTQALKLHYGRYPVAIINDGSSIDLPEYLNQYLIDFCMQRAYEMDEDWTASDRALQRMQAALSNAKTTPEERFNQGSYQQVSTVWEDYRSDAI